MVPDLYRRAGGRAPGPEAPTARPEVPTARPDAPYDRDAAGLAWASMPPQPLLSSRGLRSLVLLAALLAGLASAMLSLTFVVHLELAPWLAASLVTRAAEQSAVPVVDLDFAIWSYQRRQG